MLEIAMLKMRSRTKECHLCQVRTDVFYRYRYDGLEYWLFLCGKCLVEIKTKHDKTYQYGGTKLVVSVLR